VNDWLTFSAISEIIAITIWTGGMAVLAFIVAPAIFQTAPSRENAGRIFGLILQRVQWVAYGCAAAILLAGALRWAVSYRMQAAEVVRYIIAVLMLGVTLYSGLFVARKLERLRAQAAGATKAEAHRAEFNKLHRLSATLLVFNILLGFALAVMFALEN
jgi:uncharacterized membrane protein